MVGKRIEQARDAIVSAASDTRRAVLTVGGLALAALAVALVALLVATRSRPAHV
jgi:hypothetical protein